MLAPPLADFLRARRDDCNARFTAARRLWPRLDAGDFSLFLRDQLSPLAAALDAGHAHATLDRAYDLGLQLVAEKLAGPAAVTPAINALWTDVFPQLAAHIATAPRRLLGSLSNAAHHFAATPDTRPDFWRSRLAALGPRCSGTDELLTVAQVLAWRAGLAHFRISALAAADSLPSDLALEALGAPAEASWPEVRDAHLANPWRGYDSPAAPDRAVGLFRGFGGLFLSPPLVTRSGLQLLVLSGDETWILIADAYGATFHRAASGEIARAAPISTDLPDPVRLPSRPTSAVIVGETFAFTTAQSHAIRIGPIPRDR